MVLVSDGISSLVSDQEIVDLARGARDPKSAANRILSYAEEMGSDDNMTAIVLPLAGWGKVVGPDMTKQLREYRARQMSVYYHPSFVSGTNTCALLNFSKSARSVRRGCKKRTIATPRA